MNRLLSAIFCLSLAGTTLLVSAGCGGKSSPKKDKDEAAKASPKEGAKKHDDDDKEHEGKYGGAISEWDHNKYHAEFVADRKTGEVTVYMLGAHAKDDVAIPTEKIKLIITNLKPRLEMDLKGVAQKKDPKGSYSRFVGQDDRLKTDMLFKGEISGEVADIPYGAPFEEKAADKKKGKG